MDIKEYMQLFHQLTVRLGVYPLVYYIPTVFDVENGDKVISPFHDIPLYPIPGNKVVCNMVVEVPRWSNAKMEVRNQNVVGV